MSQLIIPGQEPNDWQNVNDPDNRPWSWFWVDLPADVVAEFPFIHTVEATSIETRPMHRVIIDARYEKPAVDSIVKSALARQEIQRREQQQQ